MPSLRSIPRSPSMRRRLLIAAALGGGLAALRPAAAQATAARKLVFSLITPRDAQQTRNNWAPFVDRLGAAVGMPVQIRTFTDQAALVEAFRNGEIDFGWMGNGPALELAETGAAAVFAQMVTKDGRFGFNSILIVRKESELRSLPDALKQAGRLSFADGDLKSASGHLVPAYYAFQKNGIEDPALVFKSVKHGSHRGNLTAVAKKEVDLATANNEELDFFKRDQPELASQLRVIWESPLIPQSPLLWKTALPADVRRRVMAFTLGFGRNNAQEARILEQLNNLSGFRQSSNAQLVPIADLEMFKMRQAINNDHSLDAAQRAQRLDLAIRRGSRLDLLLKLSSSTLY